MDGQNSIFKKLDFLSHFIINIYNNLSANKYSMIYVNTEETENIFFPQKYIYVGELYIIIQKAPLKEF